MYHPFPPNVNTITNEIGLASRSNRLESALNGGNLKVNKGAFVSVGFVKRIYDTLMVLSSTNKVSHLVLVDINPKVVTANRAFCLAKNMPVPVSLYCLPIENYVPQEAVSFVDWSNVYMWENFKAKSMETSMKDAPVNLLSDFANGNVFNMINMLEPISQFQTLPTDYLHDLTMDPRTPQSILEQNSLHALITTIPISTLFKT